MDMKSSQGKDATVDGPDHTLRDILQVLQGIKDLLSNQQKQLNALNVQNQLPSFEATVTGLQLTESERNRGTVDSIEHLEKNRPSHSVFSQVNSEFHRPSPSQEDVTLDRNRGEGNIWPDISIPWSYEYEITPKYFQPKSSLDHITDAKKLFGSAWSIPPDGRISLGFTRFELERLDLRDAKMQAKGIMSFLNRLDELIGPYGTRPGFLRVMDFSPRNDKGKLEPIEYILGNVAIGDTRSFDAAIRESSPSKKQKSYIHSAPWRRIIICEGFASAWSTSTTINPCYNFELSRTYAGTPSIMALHRYCLKRMPDREGKKSSYANQYRVFQYFHVTLFELCGSEVVDDFWNHGTLYPIHGSPFIQSFRECAFTFGIYSENGRYADVDASCPTKPEAAHWTIILLLPSKCWRNELTFDLQGENILKVAGNHSLPGISIFILVSFVLDAVLTRWQGIAGKIDGILDHEEVSFMKPNDYVHLLYDDAAFSRSRFYFWAIGCLTAFDARILNNIVQFEQYSRAQIVPLLNAHLPGHKSIVDLNKEFESNLSVLKAIHGRFQDRLGTLVSLRNGLFSASSVMESRQSRILGENVRLLTYVSIFFLPLAFGISIWNIPDYNQTYPGTKAPIIAAVVIGIITYVIVFNLNLLVRIRDMVFSKPKTYLSQKMRSEGYSADEEKLWQADWNSIGRGFESFPRPDESVKPSRWWLLIYFVKLLPLMGRTATMQIQIFWQRYIQRKSSRDNVEQQLRAT